MRHAVTRRRQPNSGPYWTVRAWSAWQPLCGGSLGGVRPAQGVASHFAPGHVRHWLALPGMEPAPACEASRIRYFRRACRPLWAASLPWCCSPGAAATGSRQAPTV